MLQNVLTLINRLDLCVTICLKFYQSNILAITLATKAWAPKNSAHMRKSPPPPHRENGTKNKEKSPPYEKSLPPHHKREKKVPQIDCFPGEPGRHLLLPPPCVRP